MNNMNSDGFYIKSTPDAIFATSASGHAWWTQGATTLTFRTPKKYYVDWTKIQSFPELLTALNALDIIVSDNCDAYQELKPWLRDEPVV